MTDYIQTRDIVMCEDHMDEKLTDYCLYCRMAKLEARIETRGNMLEDVVNELDLSDLATQQHGPMGTPPAELVRLVLTEKDLKISALKAGMIDVTPKDSGVGDE